MKALLAISVSLFTLCSAFSQKMKSDREEDGLNGKAKSVVTEMACSGRAISMSLMQGLSLATGRARR